MKLEYLPLSQEPTPGDTLGSDLEWMLGSGQVDLRALSLALAEAYFPTVYHLCLVTLQDAEQAAAAALQTLVKALLEVHRYQNGGQSDSAAWFYSLALEVLRSEQRQQKRAWRRALQRLRSKPETTLAGDEPDRVLWQAVNRLPEPLQPVVRLQALDWSFEQIAAVLHTRLETVRDNWNEALFTLWTELQELPAYAGEVSPRGLPPVLQSSLYRLWPAPEFSAADLERVAAEAAMQARRQSGSRFRRISLMETMVMLGAAVVVLGLLLGAERWLSETRPAQAPATIPIMQMKTEPPPTPAPTAVPQRVSSVTYLAQPAERLEDIAAWLNISVDKLKAWNTHLPDLEPGRTRVISFPVAALPDLVPPRLEQDISLPELKILPLDVTSDQIREFLRPQTRRWQSVWMDSWSIYYGPPGYVGPPFGVYHSQFWRQGENWSLEATGRHGEDMGQYRANEPYMYMVRKDGMQYHLDPYSDSLEITPGDADGSMFSLESLLEPAKAAWFSQAGTFYPLSTALVGRRHVMIVEWIAWGSSPQVEARKLRLWIDRETGVVLRLRAFGGASLNTVLYDVYITEMVYGVEFSSNVLPVELGGMADGFSMTADDQQTANLNFEPPSAFFRSPRKAPSLVDKYSLLGLAKRPISFVFPEEYKPDQWPMPEGVTATLYVGHEVLTTLASPPVIMTGGCDRSADGQLLAYITMAGREADSSNSLAAVWLDLTAPETLHMLELTVVNPSLLFFTPDGTQIAVFGYQMDGMGGQLLLYDLDTEVTTQVVELQSVRSVVWSPDGRYLALLGETGTNGSWAAFVIDVNLGQVVYRTQVNQADLLGGPLPEDWPAVDWPGHAWNVEFPQVESEFEAMCGE